MRLENKVALITGAYGGMGRASAQLFAKEGASGGGSIVNIGSVAGITGIFSSAYSVSKWALEGQSRSIAYTLPGWGIRCNVIQPGFIETDMTSAMMNNPLAKKLTGKTFNNTILLRRAGKAAGLRPCNALPIPGWTGASGLTG